MSFERHRCPGPARGPAGSRAARGSGGLAGLALVAGALGCTGATVGSGVGEARLEHAPYYAGRFEWAGSAIAYAPVFYQAGATQPAAFDPDAGAGTPVATLLATLNAHLDSLAVAGRLGSRIVPPAGTPPDVEFGCERDAVGECEMPDEGPGFGPGRARMRLAVGQPSADWAEGASDLLVAAGADALLLVTLEVGDYWPRQTSWRGSKAVELGTDRTEALPWLTSLETPVSVLQLTGALVGRNGKAIRIGSEGLVARRTPIALAGFGAQAVIGEEDVRALLTERSGEGPAGRPVWQAALESLVAQLVGPNEGQSAPGP